jgi:hypothetical protein
MWVMLSTAALAATGVAQQPAASPSPSPSPPANAGQTSLEPALPAGTSTAPPADQGVPGLWDIPPTADDMIGSVAQPYQPSPVSAITYFQQDPLARTAMNQARTNADNMFDGLGGVPNPQSSFFLAPITSQEYEFHIGLVNYQPSVSAGVNYRTSSGSDSDGENGGYFNFSPAVAFFLGDPAGLRTASLYYAASVQTPSRGQNPFDQSLSLTSHVEYDKTSFGLGIDFAGLSGLNRDFGGDVQRDILTLSLTSTYHYSQKSSFDVDFTLPVRQFSGGISSTGATSSFFYDYALSTKTTLGAGFTLGMLDVTGGPTQHYVDPSLTMTYQASEKLSLHGDVGLDVRDAGPTFSVNPIFGLGVTWKVREGTSLDLSGESSVENSASLTGANYTSTSITLSLSQTIARSFTASLSASFEDASYYAVQTGISANRSDQSYLLQAGISTQFARHWSTSLIVSGGDTVSNTNPLRYFQTSLQFSYSF